MMQERIHIDDYFLNMARLASLRGTCKRRQVGCILVDSNNHVVATGYNGVPKGFVHCLDNPCKGADAPSGTRLNECKAVHAEMNALLQLTSVDTLTAYVTVTPCFDCAKLMIQSGINRVVYLDQYRDTGGIDLLCKANIDVSQVSL